MSEWLKEHAWKTIPATLIEQHRNTPSHNQFNDIQLHDACRCEPVNKGVRRRLRSDLTQFLHTVLRFTCPCTNRCSSMCVDASVTGARTGWVNALNALLRSPEPLRVRIPASQISTSAQILSNSILSVAQTTEVPFSNAISMIVGVFFAVGLADNLKSSSGRRGFGDHAFP